MPESIPEQLWIDNYYGHAPFPSGRIVNRVQVNGIEQPWAADTVRYVSRRWLGPVQINAQGVVFNIRYVGVHEHTRRGAYPLHTHPHSEIIFTLSGNGAIHLPEREKPENCTQGHLVVLPPGYAHQSSWMLNPGEGWRLLVVNFDLALDLGQVLSETGITVDLAFAPFYEYFFIHNHRSLRLESPDRLPTLVILNEIASALSHRQYGLCADIVAGLLRAISLFSRELRRRDLADGHGLMPPALSKEATLLKVRRLLEQSEMLDAGCVIRIARTIGMSEEHLIREFKRVYGTTPKQYSLNVLMRRAAALLTGTDMSIKEAAFHLGYDAPSSFSRAFRNYSGLAPASYRQRNPPPPPA